MAFAGEPSAAEEETGGYGVSALARAEIPPEYLRLYLRAAARYGLDWAILAGIGKVECDHGRDSAPSCTREGAVNSAGAGGPMQFLASTWAEYGVEAEGDGPPDRWNPADAIFGAANYLRASGAPGNYRAGDLRVQPRRLVRGRGGELGGEVQRPGGIGLVEGRGWRRPRGRRRPKGRREGDSRVAGRCW